MEGVRRRVVPHHKAERVRVFLAALPFATQIKCVATQLAASAALPMERAQLSHACREPVVLREPVVRQAPAVRRRRAIQIAHRAVSAVARTLAGMSTMIRRTVALAAELAPRTSPIVSVVNAKTLLVPPNWAPPAPCVAEPLGAAKVSFVVKWKGPSSQMRQGAWIPWTARVLAVANFASARTPSHPSKHPPARAG